MPRITVFAEIGRCAPVCVVRIEAVFPLRQVKLFSAGLCLCK